MIRLSGDNDTQVRRRSDLEISDVICQLSVRVPQHSSTFVRKYLNYSSDPFNISDEKNQARLSQDTWMICPSVHVFEHRYTCQLIRKHPSFSTLCSKFLSVQKGFFSTTFVVGLNVFNNPNDLFSQRVSIMKDLDCGLKLALSI